MTNMNPYLADKIIEETLRDGDLGLRAYRGSRLGAAPSSRREADAARSRERGLGLLHVAGWRIDLTLRRG